MKKIVLLLFIAIAAGKISAQNYTPVNEGSTVTFKIKNFGFNTGGSFSGLKGTIHFDPANPAASAFDVSIDAQTINTDNETRDSHLREETYFDVKNYPLIHFVSGKVTAGRNGAFVVSGKLTIKKETKDISIPFTATPSKGAYIFDGEFKINRKDFGVGGSSTLSDNVVVNLHVVSQK